MADQPITRAIRLPQPASPGFFRVSLSLTDPEPARAVLLMPASQNVKSHCFHGTDRLSSGEVTAASLAPLLRTEVSETLGRAIQNWR